jgi:ATP-dependent DNA helicase RecQ
LTAIEALNNYFGYKTFRSGQQEIVEEILIGKNVLAILPTGAGKSICYQIPALISDNFSIVISPLIALMKDQVDAINKKQEIAAFINSTQTFAETEKVLAAISYGKIKLVYIAPERLENTDFALRLKNLKPKYLFIDEAHCISEWGHNFRPSYTKLKAFIDFTGIKNISAFTATATPEVVKDIIKQLGLKNVQLIVKGFERNNLFLNVEITKKKKEKCLELLQQHKTPAIIYASSRKNTEQLTEFLLMNKITCNYYHAGLDPIIRKKIQEDFIEDKLPVIVATNAFGMGIDKKDIRLVIHFNAPGSIENYYQEIGRAGRDGKDSFTYLLFDESDKRIHEFFISNSYPTKDLIKNIYNALCDNAQIALGNKPVKEIPVDLRYIKLYLKENINSSLIHSSLKYLEEAGYLKINSALYSRSKIKILFDSTRLKNFIKQTTNDLMKTLLLNLLRNFGSDIFTNSKSLDINKIQIDTGLTNEEILETLTNLEFLGIIEFTKAELKDTVTLLQPRVKAEELKLNYKLINEFYISAKQKLDQMTDFVYSNECRFKFILNYFGESANNYRCGKCDNCLRYHQPAAIGVEYVKERILDLLSEADSPLTEKEISDILLGKKVNTIYRTLKTYASLSGYKVSEISLSLKSLLTEKKITLSKSNKQKIYSLFKEEVREDLSIIESETQEVKSEQQFFNYDFNLELFHKLREIREDASRKFLQSPNIICPDSLMSKVAQLKPKTKSELLGIPGFNERMYNKIGNEFLTLINYSTDYNLTSKKIPEEKLPSNVQNTFRYLKQGYSLSEISRLRKLAEAVISMQIETIISYLPEVNLSGVLPDNQFELISKEVKKGYDSLKELKERLPKEISYPLIRIALARIKAQN